MKIIEKIKFLLLIVPRYELDFSGEEMLILAIDFFNKKTTHEGVLISLAKMLNEMDTSIAKHQYFNKRFGKRGFYEWEGIKYFLYEYEEFLQSQTKTSRNKLNWNEYIKNERDYLTTEHIFPQKSKKNDWLQLHENFTAQERRLLNNSLGNLLPLSKSKNSSLSNKSFTEKLGDKDNLVGFKYGCYSEIEVAENLVWDEKIILNRGLKLLHFMEQRWEFNLGNEDNKIDILGLNFLNYNKGK